MGVAVKGKLWKRFGIAVAAAALMACAPQEAPAPSEASDPASVAAPAASGERLIAAFSAECRSSTQFACGQTQGCAEKQGDAQEPPVLLTFEGPTGAGQMCIIMDGQPVCRAVAVNVIPGETPGAGDSLTGLVMSEIPQDDANAPPDYLFDGLLTLGADGQTFRLVQANPQVAAVWSGACVASSPTP